MIILKPVLKTQGTRAPAVFIWFRGGANGRLYLHGNKPSSSTKDGKSVVQLSDY
jgi:hypothetical protein